MCACMGVHMPVYTEVCAHVPVYTRVHVYVDTCMYTCMPMCACMRVGTCVHTCVHTHVLHVSTYTSGRFTAGTLSPSFPCDRASDAVHWHKKNSPEWKWRQWDPTFSAEVKRVWRRGYNITGVTASQGGQDGHRVAAGMDSAVTRRLLLSAAPRSRLMTFGFWGCSTSALPFLNPLLIQWARIQDPCLCSTACEEGVSFTEKG